MKCAVKKPQWRIWKKHSEIRYSLFCRSNFFDDYAKIHMILGDNGKPSKYQFVQKKYLKKSGTPQADEYENPFLDDYDRSGYTEDIYELPEVYYEINWEAFGNPISYRHIYEKYI